MTISLATAQVLLPRTLITPQLRSVQDVDTPTAIITGTIAGVLTSATVVEPSAVVWQLATPMKRWIGTIRLGVLLAIYLAIVTVVAPIQTPASVNVLATAAGEALISTAIIGYRLAWLIPGVHAAVTMLLGAQGFGFLSWWAWPGDPDPSHAELTVSAILLIIGIASVHRYGTSGISR